MTFDVFKHTDEISILIAGVGMDTAPVVINRTSGASTACRPTRTSGIPGLTMSCGVGGGRSRPGPHDNAWVGTLPIDRGVLEAQLSFVVGGEVRNATVSWPEPKPALVPPPEPKPTRARRARKARA